MEKLMQKIKYIWMALTYKDGLDKEYDQLCDDAFLKFLDKVVVFSYAIFSIVAMISIYFIITREIL